MTNHDSYTEVLFAHPSFVEGVARSIDVGDTLTEYNRSDDPDAIALAADWRTVGNDLRRAAEQLLHAVSRE